MAVGDAVAEDDEGAGIRGSPDLDGTHKVPARPSEFAALITQKCTDLTSGRCSQQKHQPR